MAEGARRLGADEFEVVLPTRLLVCLPRDAVPHVHLVHLTQRPLYSERPSTSSDVQTYFSDDRSQ